MNAIAVAPRHPLGLALAVAIAALSTSGCATYAGSARPIDPARLTTEPGWITAAPTPDVRQHSLLDCGAAALAMVAGRWQVHIAIDDPAIAAPGKNGIRLGDLRSAARAHGLVAFAIKADRTTLDHELRAKRPVIVGLLRPYARNKAVSHYEVVIAMRGDEIVTLDPAAGYRVRPWASLEAEWRAAAYPALVVLGPS
ncbi:MAG TPA: cysteine peptidase family C39 domain-containing protein [Kofleriaceae bacterium]